MPPALTPILGVIMLACLLRKLCATPTMEAMSGASPASTGLTSSAELYIRLKREGYLHEVLGDHETPRRMGSP
jgi:hypothetical protein